MGMKEIAQKFCKLPEGEYKLETKIGNVEVICVKDDDERFFSSSIMIKINNKPYMKIDQFRNLFSVANYKKLPDNTEYKLLINYNSNIRQITCGVNQKPIFIKHNSVYNTTNDEEYTVVDNVMKVGFGTTEIPMTYNLLTNEKTIYLRKPSYKTYSEYTSNDFIKTNAGIINVISKYNKLVEMINHSLIDSVMADEDFKSYKDSIRGIAESSQIPLLDITEIKKADDEISLMAQLYKKYAPLLEETHSKEMIETLNDVADTLTKQYCAKDNSTQNKKGLSKKFDINNYKNN